MIAKRLTAMTTLAVALLVLGQTAGAAGTVTIGGTSRNGNVLSVTGGSTYTDTAQTTLGTDGTGDTFLAPQAQLGGDLVAASIASRTNNQIVVRWSVDQLPPVVNGSPTGLAYGFAFCAGSESNCFEVDAQRAGIGAASANPIGALWRCADAACAPNAQTSTTYAPAVTFDATAKTITATVAHSAIGAAPGMTLTPVPASPQGPSFVMVGDATGVTFADFADGILEVEPYTIASKQVSVAVGARGQDPASVAYVTTVAPTGTGAYSASVNVGGLTGDQAVYVQACFGPGNCGFATQDITL